MKTLNLKRILPVALWFAGGILFAQQAKLAAIDKAIERGDLLVASKALRQVDTNKMGKPDKAFYYLLHAKYHGNKNSGESYTFYLKAKDLYIQIDSIDRAMEINISLAYLATSTQFENTHGQKYLDAYLEYAKRSKDPVKLAKAYVMLGTVNMQKDGKRSLDYLQKARKLRGNNNLHVQHAINNNLAVIYNEVFEKHDSSLYFLRKDLPYLISHKKANGLCENYINQAANYYYLHDHMKSIAYLKRADSVPINNKYAKTKCIINSVLSLNYQAIGDYKKAFESLQLYMTFNDSIKEDQQNIAVNDIEAKYGVKAARQKMLVLDKEVKLNRLIIIIIVTLIIAIFIFTVLTVKNLRRKQVIAEQEKVIEQQKLEKAIRDHEFNSIDSMLEGQEKERKRMADELHDNLGSMLAALKLNFQHLKVRRELLKDDENRLYEKTDELIEEAYQKVRGIAHAQNAGVMANLGLVPAIQKMAEKIAIPNKIHIQVVPFGLNERLESTLEITLFRMVQELVTNIIKHANASKITIHITQHENSLNIIAEDNGSGFDPAIMGRKDGMGLQNIEKKVKQLDGEFSIDSQPGRGTTVIIDIPI